MNGLPYYGKLQKLQKQRYHAEIQWADILTYILRKYFEHYTGKPAYGKDVDELMDEIGCTAGPGVLERAKKEALGFYLIYVDYLKEI